MDNLILFLQFQNAVNARVLLMFSHKIHIIYRPYPQFIHIMWILLCKLILSIYYVDNSKNFFFIIKNPVKSTFLLDIERLIKYNQYAIFL